MISIAGQTYKGASFIEMLRVDYPGLIPDFSGLAMTELQMRADQPLRFRQ